MGPEVKMTEVRMTEPQERKAFIQGEKDEVDLSIDKSSQRQSSLELDYARVLNPAERPVQQNMASAKVANPAPLGLLGFGLTTILLNIHNTGLFPLETAVVGMGICFGGIAQFIAGLLEFYRGNTFAYVAFTSYGSFWVSLVCLWMLKNNVTNPGVAVRPTDSTYLASYLLLWGIFTLTMFFGTLRSNLVLMFVFGSLVILFALLSAGNFAKSPTTLKVAGYEGIVCGISAFYLAIAEVVNEVYESNILPIGKVDLVHLCRQRRAAKSKRARHSV
ncbi:putative GTP-binding protein typA/BipA-like [Trypanosoma theileri]|uniref:Putative GTP-binding protein typA/BipA-like n=1 Tax=Trypanosoma theileri TaxID=67003 RepID=A0A1X0P9Q6_9TRYP|nr:putative GTP-binding protein typA/BipA-like [Trypanosoma theileri]ORC93329.1 putative GTP-binding protein typA/BipA-like [Trypanosoma theileri]